MWPSTPAEWRSLAIAAPRIWPSTAVTVSASAISRITWLIPTPHRLTVYASAAPLPDAPATLVIGWLARPYPSGTFPRRIALTSPSARRLRRNRHEVAKGRKLGLKGLLGNNRSPHNSRHCIASTKWVSPPVADTHGPRLKLADDVMRLGGWVTMVESELSLARNRQAWPGPFSVSFCGHIPSSGFSVVSRPSCPKGRFGSTYSRYP